MEREDSFVAEELQSGATWQFNVTTSNFEFSSNLSKLVGQDACSIAHPSDIVAFAQPSGRRSIELSRANDIAEFKADPIGVITATQNYDLIFLSKDSSRWLRLQAEVIASPDSEQVRIIGRLDNITRVVRIAERVQEQARIDRLSGVLRPEPFADIVIEWLTPNAKSPVYFLAYINIDLDMLRLINSRYGHEGGNEVIASLGQQLRAIKSPYIQIGRVGGDEFAIIARCKSHSEYEKILKLVHDQLNYNCFFSSKVKRGGHSHLVTAAMGVATSSLSHSPDEAAAVLRSQSDVAVFAAKDRRENYYVEYTPELEEAYQRDTLSHSMFSAIREGHLPIALQPVADFRSGRIIGVELLLDDITKNNLGVESNEAVVKLMERYGLLVEYDLGSLHLAMNYIQEINKDFPGSNLCLAINISPHSLIATSGSQNGDMANFISDLCEWNGFPPSSLHIELSEDYPLKFDEPTQSVLRRLKALGIEIVCDDFGKQHSNVERILRFNAFTTIKIDKFLVSLIGDHDSPDQDFVLGMIRLLRERGFKVCAEGVETLAQYHKLKDAGCTSVQGYILQGKLDGDGLKAFLKANDFHCWLEENLSMLGDS